MRAICSVTLGVIVSLAIALPVAAQSGPTQAELDAAGQQGANWLYATHDYTGQRFVDLNEITPANVKNLRPVAIFQASELGPVQTNPLVYDGVMYLTTAHTVVAIDAATAHRKWEYVWKPKDKENYNTNRGAAIKDGLVVRGTPDGYLIALDASAHIRNLSEVAWRSLGNVDWRRDLVIPGGVVDHFAPVDGPRCPFGIDATAKGPADGHPRGWPQENVMSAEIKALVDTKWAQYGIK